jgi:hypothetical protein
VTEDFETLFFMEPNPYSKQGYQFYDEDSEDSEPNDEEDPRFDPEESDFEEVIIERDESPKRKRSKTGHSPTSNEQSPKPQKKSSSSKSSKEEKKNLLDYFNQVFNRKDIPTVFWREGAIGVEKLSTPLEFFELYWNESIIESIILESRKSKKQLELDVSSFFLFLAVTLYMGLDKLPTMKMYWSKTDELGLGSEWVSKSGISRDKFLSIHRGLSFSRRVLINHIRSVGQQHWEPYQWLALDEMMVAFKGETKCWL